MGVANERRQVRLAYGYRYSYLMRPLRYSINVTLDGCCDHRVMLADEDLHRHAVENLNRADALLFGRPSTTFRSLGTSSIFGYERA